MRSIEKSLAEPMVAKLSVLMGLLVIAGLPPATEVFGSETPDDREPADAITSLPAWHKSGKPPAVDWLIDGSSFKAGVFRGEHPNEIVLANGLIARTFRLTPNAATVGLDNLVTGEAILRGVKPEAIVELDGQRYDVGGLKGQDNYAFLRPDWLAQLRSDPAAFRFIRFEVGRPTERLAWKQVRHHPPDVRWPPAGVSLRLDFIGPTGATLAAAGLRPQEIRVSVHYELYDGIPCYSKWLTISNGTDRPIRVDRFSSEVLAAVERTAEVDELTSGRTPPNLHVETDMAFGGMMAAGANRRSFRWLPDSDFPTQVNYEKKTPCLLDVGPDLGPAQDIAPGSIFETFQAWVLPFDSSDRERCGLAMRRMYRVIAPWATENPLMMHVRSADERTVTNAVSQCAETGFELVILSFGSGFDLENETPATLALAQCYAEYARRKGIEIGSYSLLASRHVGGGNDVVMPPGQNPTFGNSPCLVSPWGTNYFRRLYEFHRESGFTLLEHDGSYPGDVCQSDQHPGHHGLADSRWNQWRVITDFYKWCRGQGIYLNVPDHYFLAGSSKTGMGYRESNWSLRASSRSSTRARTSLTARGRSCQAWAGCLCRSRNTKAAAPPRPSNRWTNTSIITSGCWRATWRSGCKPVIAARASTTPIARRPWSNTGWIGSKPTVASSKATSSTAGAQTPATSTGCST